jgi:hypothetical protein
VNRSRQRTRDGQVRAKSMHCDTWIPARQLR